MQWAATQACYERSLPVWNGCFHLAETLMRLPLILFVLVLSVAPATARDLPRSALPDGFVYLRDVAPSIAQDIRYATPDNFTGRPLPGYGAAECILKREVAQALARVQADLARHAHDPEKWAPVFGKDHARGIRLGLKVYDCYRPARAVAAMWRWSQDASSGGDKRFYPNLAKRELFARGFISAQSRHSSGIAVDVTLVALASAQSSSAHSRASGNPGSQTQILPVAPGSPLEPVLGPAEGRTRVRGRAASEAPCTAPAGERGSDGSLDMGTGFDCLDPASATNSAAVTPAQRAWRNLLKAAMARAGFRNYFREWWHYEYAGAPQRRYDFPITKR
jgi:D-alanyl-D-alanine dipeptidase